MNNFGNELLEELAGRFATWRKGKLSIRQRIPKELWDEAVAACEFSSPGKVAHRLGLDPSKLNRRLGSRGNVTGENDSGFIMLGESMTVTHRPLLVTMKSPGGRSASVEMQSFGPGLLSVLKLALDWLG